MLGSGSKNSQGPSLRLRLLVGMSVTAIVFLSAAGFVLDRAFQASARRAAEEQLDVRLLSLVGTAEPVGRGVEVPLSSMDTRWSQPGSGIYGVILDGSSRVLWRSSSLAGRDITALLGLRADEAGTRKAEEIDSPLGELLVSSARLYFERSDGTEVELIFIAALGSQALAMEVDDFRRTLWLGLGAVALVLVLVELFLFRQFTQPLAKLAQAVSDIERGERNELGEGWPQEVASVTQNFDRFIAHERQLRERYAHLTDDLAHSLKTPLAVLKNEAARQGDEAEVRVLREQVERMEQVLSTRLERVRVRSVLARVESDLLPETNKIVKALSRIYPSHNFNVLIDADTKFPGETRDLMELLGNLIENAAKYGRSQVRVSAQSVNKALRLDVEDDGPGIPQAVRASVIERGVRADTRAEGQGIGLAIVAQLVRDLYFGNLEIDTSKELGGAKISVLVPQR